MNSHWTPSKIDHCLAKVGEPSNVSQDLEEGNSAGIEIFAAALCPDVGLIPPVLAVIWTSPFPWSVSLCIEVHTVIKLGVVARNPYSRVREYIHISFVRIVLSTD